MKHWLKRLMPKNADARTLAQRIEDADERIAGLKEQIIAVQARRAELEEEAQTMAADALPDGKLAQLLAASEASTLENCKHSAMILHTDLRRLFAESSPFLSELAQPEMDKALSIHDNVARWLSRF
ncbi:hypothetical protein [Pseudomonas aeruginosa]|uniref:hypothetical protein n=1 Tax=Pseudomonas aeruginosa TaxID=287 RepID=UPI000EB5FEA2|nr:hypothetical protein [Pseudomonas aeruginosa]